MNKNARPRGELVRYSAQAWQGHQLVSLRFIKMKDPPETVFEKIVLLPLIEYGVEFWRHFASQFIPVSLGQIVQLRDFIKRGLVKGTADHPFVIAKTEEVSFAQVLNPDQAFFWVMKVNSRSSNSAARKEFSDSDIMPVFLALEIIFDQNERLVR